jgi:hypothetical protein
MELGIERPKRGKKTAIGPGKYSEKERIRRHRRSPPASADDGCSRKKNFHGERFFPTPREASFSEKNRRRRGRLPWGG